ncbi:MAG: hypothetical protein ACR2PT_00200 [Endozoicomonas sp.]
MTRKMRWSYFPMILLTSFSLLLPVACIGDESGGPLDFYKGWFIGSTGIGAWSTAQSNDETLGRIVGSMTRFIDEDTDKDTKPCCSRLKDPSDKASEDYKETKEELVQSLFDGLPPYSQFSDWMVPYAMALEAGGKHKPTLSPYFVGNLYSEALYPRREEVIDQLYPLLSESLISIIKSNIYTAVKESQFFRFINGKVGYYFLLESSDGKGSIERKASSVLYLVERSVGSGLAPEADTSKTAMAMQRYLGMESDNYPVFRNEFLSTSRYNRPDSQPLNRMVQYVVYLVLVNRIDWFLDKAKAGNSMEDFEGLLKDFLASVSLKAHEVLARWLFYPQGFHACYDSFCYGLTGTIAWPFSQLGANPKENWQSPVNSWGQLPYDIDPRLIEAYKLSWKDQESALSLSRQFKSALEYKSEGQFSDYARR